jgi:hypothetical protein
MKRVTIAVLGLCLGTGCSVHLDPKVPKGSGAARQGSFGVGAAARGMPSRVGWGTFTVFAIPVAPVSISNGPGERIVMQKIKETLAAAGYQPVEGGGAGPGPVLECDVKRFSFRNYTWLFPIVPTWGGVELALKLVDPQGAPLWERSYTAKSSNLTYSFSGVANGAMEKALEAMGRDFASDEFFRACCAREVVAAAP